MEDRKVGGAMASARRSVSKLLVSSSHTVAKDHHGSYTYEVPSNDQIRCETPGYVGALDLQVPVLGPAMANVVHGVDDKLYVYVAQSGSSNPNFVLPHRNDPAWPMFGQRSPIPARDEARRRRCTDRSKVFGVSLSYDESFHHYPDFRNRPRFRDL